jgi:hypothetical protein
MAPQVGLEPTTLRLTVQFRRTGQATPASQVQANAQIRASRVAASCPTLYSVHGQNTDRETCVLLLAASNSVDYEFGLVSYANLGVRRFFMQRRLMLHTERLLLDEIARTLRENAAASAGSKRRIAATDHAGLLSLDPRQILIGQIEVYDPRERRPR